MKASVPTEGRREPLRESLAALTTAVTRATSAYRARIDAALPRHRESAENLAHYLGLRQQDVRELQLELAAIGLSSLGRSEGHVLDILERLGAWLANDADRAASDPEDRLDWARARAILHENTHALFGERPTERHVYIMVTAPDAAEVTPDWADRILDAGADILRINAAHGDADGWRATAACFTARATLRGRPGRVIVDLPGPKFRAELRQRERAVLHFARKKDRLGKTTEPTLVTLVAEHGGEREVPIPPSWLPALERGDVLELTDAAGRKRQLVVERSEPTRVIASSEQSLYVVASLPLTWRRGDATLGEGSVGSLPFVPTTLRLSPGDAFVLSARDDTEAGDLPELTMPEPGLLAQVRPGERVILDDGKIAAVVEERRGEGLVCRVHKALRAPTRLRSGKGIAFPDSTLEVPGLGERDALALRVALEVAHGVGVSFVSSAADVADVGERIRAAEKPGFGMILKLETRGAMDHLPDILFEAMKYHPVGLMIARGDLAVELTFERLAEMQEELLWFGEACHLPVVWATEVLDTVAHSGVPTRAEVTDAAMSMRAECVMLNKGPFIADATRMLADIIHKMEKHQYKKRSLFRKLGLAKERS